MVAKSCVFFVIQRFQIIWNDLSGITITCAYLGNDESELLSKTNHLWLKMNNCIIWRRIFVYKRTNTWHYILDEIYIKKKLQPICTRLIFKRLLLKLTTESTFIFQSNFYKQTDGCTMGGPLSVTFANIFQNLKMKK